MPRRVTVLIVSPLALLAACGNSRTPVPSASRPAAPQGFRGLSYPGAGIWLRAQSALIAAVRARDPTLRLVSSSLVSVDGAGLVLDESAPPTDFGAVNRAVFAAVSRLLRFFPARAP